MTLLAFIGVFAIGYWLGKRVGVAQTMLRVQGILDDLRRIDNSFQQWNEDQL